jgi:hypothetical protein
MKMGGGWNAQDRIQCLALVLPVLNLQVVTGLLAMIKKRYFCSACLGRSDKNKLKIKYLHIFAQNCQLFADRVASRLSFSF